MTRFTSLVIIGLALIPLAVFGEVIDPSVPLPETAFWQAVLAILQGFKGGTVLGIAALVVQAAMILFVTPYGSFAGVAKRRIVLGLSCVAVFIGNLIAGLDVMAALFTGPMLAALQIFFFELVSPKPVNPIG